VLGVLLSSFIAAAGIWYSNDQVSQEMGIAQEGQITDRYTKAVENLGEDTVDVRLGGIYALQRIMEDSPRDHPTISDVLAAFVRTHAGRPPKKDAGLPADLRAAATVLAYRNHTGDKGFILDLRSTHLPGIELQRRGSVEGPVTRIGSVAYLNHANLWHTDLSGAILTDARISNANLDGANLTEADLRNADLHKTMLNEADLHYAGLINADLRNAGLTAANLIYANLRGADLRNTYLTDADLRYASLIRADLRNANLDGANLDGADLRGAKLTGVNLLQAHLSPDTRLPPSLARDPAIKARIAEYKKTGNDH